MKTLVEALAFAEEGLQCDGCGRVIDTDDLYRRVIASAFQQAFVWKVCQHCDAFMRLIDEAVTDTAAAALLADVEPFDIAVDRWRALHRRQWRRRDGQLYPIPRSDVA